MGEYVPGTHGVHAAALSVENVPGAHDRQPSLEPAARDVPLAQGQQRVELAAATAPGGQSCAQREEDGCAG